MKLSLSKNNTTKIIKAIAEFNLIEEGDRILVGLSGGKDSTYLLYALAVLQKHLAINFELSALTVDLGFPRTDFTPLRELCRELQIPFYLEKTEIMDYILKEEKGNPCAKCAHFRKGAMAQVMKKIGYKKIAFGHHYNDAVETFLMSILYSGQLVTFQPRQYLSNNDIYIIRPLVYLREKYIIEAIKELGFEPLGSPCPYNGKTKREEIKEYIKGFTDNKQVFFNLASAMRGGGHLELWPAPLDDEELSKRMLKLWKG